VNVDFAKECFAVLNFGSNSSDATTKPNKIFPSSKAFNAFEGEVAFMISN